MMLSHSGSAFIFRSTYNHALVQAYVYSGSPTPLTWDIQHNVCNNAGAQTPGSSSPSHQNKYCSYSPIDNYIVTSSCNWSNQPFTWVSGNLNGNSAYMCAHSNCDHVVKLSGTSSITTTTKQTINTGDFVMCSTGGKVFFVIVKTQKS